MIGKITHFYYCLWSIISWISWLCVWSTYFGMEIDHKQWKASIIIHFVDQTMQVMKHFHLTPPLMFQYAPQLITVYSTTIMLVLCITAVWISGDIDALHQLSLVSVIYIYLSWTFTLILCNRSHYLHVHIKVNSFMLRLRTLFN